jgi:hypothetical protein
MRGKIGKQIIKYSVLIVMLLALTTSIAVPAMAQAPASALHSVQATVTAVTAPAFTIQNGTQTPVTITTDGNTKFYMVPMGRVNNWVNNQINKDIKQYKGKQTRPGAMRQLHIPANWKGNLGFLETFDVKAKFTDIEIGDRVIARVSGNNNLATQVMVIKAPVIQTIKGNITAVSGNSITVTPTSGTAVIVNVGPKTVITLHGILAVQPTQYAVTVYNKKTLVAQTLNVQASAPAPKTPNAAVNAPAASSAATLSAITVTANPAVSGNFTAGSTRLFTATGSYSNGSAINITGQVVWASSNPAVATITNTGSATAVAQGTTNITASKEGVTSPAVVLTVGP